MSATRQASQTISPTSVGARVDPFTHPIDARWLMAYAAALGETDFRYFDTLTEAGPLAHPVFPVCYEWPAAVALRAATIAVELHPFGVHATHHLVIHRLPRAGDTLHTRARVVAVEPRRAGTLVVARFETTDADGEPVTSTDYGSVYRGVTVSGSAPVAEPVTAPATRAKPPAPRWTEVVTVDVNAARVYTECARIWNPIHTDVAVARGAGLADPDPARHGDARAGRLPPRRARPRRRRPACAGDPRALHRDGSAAFVVHRAWRPAGRRRHRIRRGRP